MERTLSDGTGEKVRFVAGERGVFIEGPLGGITDDIEDDSPGGNLPPLKPFPLPPLNVNASENANTAARRRTMRMMEVAVKNAWKSLLYTFRSSCCEKMQMCG